VYRFVVYTRGGVQRFELGDRPLVVGSHPECDVALAYPGVAPRHLELSVRDGELRVRDLGSGKGVLVNGRRVASAPLQVLDEVRVGTATLLVEDVRANPRPEAAPVAPANPRSTGERLLEHVGRLSHWVVADSESRTTLESLVRRLLLDFGGGVLFLFQLGEDPRNPTVRLAVATDPAWLQIGDSLLETVAHERRASERRDDGEVALQLTGRPAQLGYRTTTTLGRQYLLVTVFFGWPSEAPPPITLLAPLTDLVILGLVHHVGRYEPILPGAGPRSSLLLPPGLVLGESPAMAVMVEQLSAAVDPPVAVLLRGERGTGKELLARALHDSGERRTGPFVAATAAGADPLQVAADLFGAEVAGRSGPLLRPGKLAQAHKGTLYLADVDQLSADAQARLLRFLRTGELVPLGGREGTAVDVRLIASAPGPLEPLVARDRFRADLVERLARAVVDVPALRERREDLPLLVQTFLNRFCHQAGKRVRGVTVRAMAALTAYTYPGNLSELENVVRQMVTLCRHDEPVDLRLLPTRITAAETRLAPRVDPASDLDLGRLVDATERAAIREALRRAYGNKAQAARLLGLSRNGLGQKMERLGIEVEDVVEPMR
jgi:transcriptional regulator with AAA-type ATPase domain